MKRTPKEYYKILKRVNSSEQFVTIHSNDPNFSLYEELRNEGFLDSRKDSHWKSGESSADASKIIYECSPTIKGIRLQYQIRTELFHHRVFAFFGGVLLSAVVSSVTFSVNHILLKPFMNWCGGIFH